MDTPASELIENVTQADPASALDGLLQAGWGKLTVGRLLSALLLLLVCLAVVRLLLGMTRRLVGRAALDERIKRYILRGVRAFLYLLTALVMAGSLNIDVSSLIALVGVFGLAVSLAVQDVLGNVAGGMVLLFSKPFTLGDYVSTAGVEG